MFKPSSFHWSNVSGFHFADPKTAGVIFFLAWIFVISWNAIAMEAAACYIGECRDPARDAKIALTAEGLYGVFIYIATAIVFVGVLGASLKSADPLTLYTSFADHIFGTAGWVKYLIGIPLIVALLLSVLNAIMGVGRSLFQASEDRLIPKFFEHKNKHHVPDRAMVFNLVCAMIVGLFGSPVRIYIFSNVGYLIAVVAALFGYFLVRQFRPEQVSPFRLPGFFRWIALAWRSSSPSTTSSAGGTRPTSWSGPGRATPSTSSASSSWPPTCRCTLAQDDRQAARDRPDSDAMPVVVGSPGRHRPRRHGRTRRWSRPSAVPSLSAMQAETEL